MSRIASEKRRSENAIVAGYECRTCGANVGEWCANTRGPNKNGPARNLHTSRWSQYLNRKTPDRRIQDVN